VVGVGVIPLRQLQEMFGSMRQASGWNVDGPLLWGYFFTDSAPERLQKAADFLVAEGYRFVGINENEPGLFVLHVERVETHSAETLFERNAKLSEVSDRFDLESYDGMDVGPVVAVN
jgi:hypothetical protein